MVANGSASHGVRCLTMNAEDAIQRIELTIQQELAQIVSSFRVDAANNIDSRIASLELTRAASPMRGGAPRYPDVNRITLSARR